MFALKAKNLSSADGIAHGFFGRRGGVSEGIFASLNCGPGSGDDRARVIENRNRVLASLADGADAKLVTLYQIHSPRAVAVAVPWDIGSAPEADAMVTNVPGIALGILTADCAPVLLADHDSKVIGAAHAGWKGAAAGVIASVVNAMEELGANRARIRAAIGPTISQANYEVGPEFRARFMEMNPLLGRHFAAGARPEHWQFDLEGFVGQRLGEAGVGDVERLSVCTYADADAFFSFRRTTHRRETDYGRDISAILLRP
jgi:purine-nucleoside/S-methyl-5'-thioadenosine phosphorylase / adenosine deaminase